MLFAYCAYAISLKSLDLIRSRDMWMTAACGVKQHNDFHHGYMTCGGHHIAEGITPVLYSEFQLTANKLRGLSEDA
jgi:hypothetical protein